jgi:hypothetical protein
MQSTRKASNLLREVPALGHIQAIAVALVLLQEQPRIVRKHVWMCYGYGVMPSSFGRDKVKQSRAEPNTFAPSSQESLPRATLTTSAQTHRSLSLLELAGSLA